MHEAYRWFLIVISAALFIACDSLSAAWGKQGKVWPILLIFLLAPLGYITFGLLNKSTTLSVSSGLVNIMLVIGTIVIGIFYFQDQLTIQQGIGLVFAVLAIVLMI